MMVLLKGGNFDITAEAVVFDKDGTLTEGLSVWRRIFFKQMETAQNMGLNISEIAGEIFGVEDDSQSTPLAIAYSSEEETLMATAIWLAHHFGWDECRKLARQVIDKAKKKLKDEDLFVPVPGAQKAVKEISRYVPVAIATSDSHENTERLLRSWDLTDEVDFIITSSEVKNGKPAPDMLKRICEFFDVKCDKLLMIGDNKVDVEMAKSVGCKVVTVGTNLEGADGWIKDFTYLDVKGERG